MRNRQDEALAGFHSLNRDRVPVFEEPGGCQVIRKTLHWMARTSLLLSILLSTSAVAEPEMPLSSELLDMENVLAVISGVNIRQMDKKTNQAILEIMEEKSQMYQPDYWLIQQKKAQQGSQLATFGKKPASKQNRRAFF